MKKYILIISVVLLSLTMLFGNNTNTNKNNVSIDEAFSHGMKYFNGNTVELDYHEASKWFYVGAQHWDEDSMLYYALSLLNINENYLKEEAFYWMSLALYFGAEDADEFWNILAYMIPWNEMNSILDEVDEDLMEEGFEKPDWDSWL